jgi:hypothetical protein
VGFVLGVFPLYSPDVQALYTKHVQTFDKNVCQVIRALQQNMSFVLDDCIIPDVVKTKDVKLSDARMVYTEPPVWTWASICANMTVRYVYEVDRTGPSVSLTSTSTVPTSTGTPDTNLFSSNSAAQFAASLADGFSKFTASGKAVQRYV